MIMKKFLAFIVVALVAINLYGASEVTSGECGDNLSWEYFDGVLTISGTGYMYNYNPGKAPWNDICRKIKSIVFDGEITSIGNEAFYDCLGLTSITIPNSVTEIGNSAFYFCSGLASIKVASSNSYYDSRNNCNAIIERSTNKLIAGCKNTIIPNSVTEIGDYAF